MKISDVTRFECTVSNGWEVTHNELLHLSIDEIETITELDPGVEVLDIYFLQDLFQAVNRRERKLLDVGWYPDGDPKGSYVLLLLNECHDRVGHFDWDYPEDEFTTRDYPLLFEKIQAVLSSCSGV
ncbi:MAG: hypothetical protein Q8M16_02315 [Pirellulaceae bacterium]|nr:hypothetical protein [Pirellulaceae bacterium]